MEFVGRRTGVRTNFICNYDRRWFAVAEDKLLYQSTLAGMGLPVPELVAVYRAHRKHAGVPVMNESAQLEAFLRGCKDSPLFGKPNSARWSVGAVSLDAYVTESDAVKSLFGEPLGVSQLAGAIERYADTGYLFQKRSRPAPRARGALRPRPTDRARAVHPR